MTEQRRVIYQVVMQSDDHPTADTVYARARELMPSIAIGTVYRNLNLLADSGAVKRIRMTGEPDRYDRTLKEHEHLVCVRCKRVFDCFIEPGAVKASAAQAANSAGAELISYELTLRCICSDCQKELSADRTTGVR